MEAVKRLPALLGKKSKIGIRCLHSTPQCMAKRGAMPSPKVVRASKQAYNEAFIRMNQPQASIESSLPPQVMLNSAKKSGAIDLDVDRVYDFLRAYQLELKTKRASWERKLCEEHGVSLMTVTILAGILRRCQTPSQQMLAKNLMLSASSLGEKSATFELIQSAINTGNLNKYQEQLQRLGLLAKKDHDPEAMMLLGKVLLSQGQNKEALLWLQKSTQPPTGNLQINGAGDALVNEGRILLQLGQTKEAENAFKKAALELDEPSGYFYLSQLQKSGTPDQKVYLLKAASSGILEACHNLGALELEEIEKRDQKPTSLQDYGMAKEWFDVAAADGFGLSMLNLALMHKAVGHEAESLAWLKKAQNLPEVKEQAIELRQKWSKTISSLP